jgi:hypothetical protein
MSTRPAYRGLMRHFTLIPAEADLTGSFVLERKENLTLCSNVSAHTYFVILKNKL